MPPPSALKFICPSEQSNTQATDIANPGAIDFFSTWKAVYADDSDKLQPVRIDNADERIPVGPLPADRATIL
jgi:hypothetical protein